MLLAGNFFNGLKGPQHMIDLFPNWTLLPMWGIFMTVLFVLTRFVFEPTMEIIEERKNQGENLVEDSKTLVEKTKTLSTQYQEKIQEAKWGALKEKELILNESRLQEANLINQARKQSEDKLNAIRTHLETERKEAQLQLKTYVEMLAEDITNTILEKKVA